MLRQLLINKKDKKWKIEKAESSWLKMKDR